MADDDVKPRGDYDEADQARLDAEADADEVAGRLVPHSEVIAWVRSWGSDHGLPRPTPKPR